MNKKITVILTPMIILFTFLICSTISYGQPAVTSIPPEIPCNAYILINLDTGKVLAEKNADKKIYPASTTKIMTAMLALELSPVNKVMTASYDAIINIGAGGMHIGILQGEKMKFQDYLKAVMLSSANDAANIIAENSASSRARFIELMNKKAAEIGAAHTHFVNCHGMYSSKHYSTARDLSVIARYALTQSTGKDTLLKITSTRPGDYTLPKTNKHKKWFGLKATNHLWDYPSKFYNKILGLKTGFVSQSAHNFIGVVKDARGNRLLSVISGVKTSLYKNSVFYYTNKLLNYGYRTFYPMQAAASVSRGASSYTKPGKTQNKQPVKDTTADVAASKEVSSNLRPNPISMLYYLFIILAMVITILLILYTVRNRKKLKNRRSSHVIQTHKPGRRG